MVARRMTETVVQKIDIGAHSASESAHMLALEIERFELKDQSRNPKSFYLRCSDINGRIELVHRHIECDESLERRRGEIDRLKAIMGECRIALSALEDSP